MPEGREGDRERRRTNKVKENGGLIELGGGYVTVSSSAQKAKVE